MNALFDNARQLFAEGAIKWKAPVVGQPNLGDAFGVVLIKAGTYAPQFGSHKYLVDVPLAARVGVAALIPKEINFGGSEPVPRGTLDAEDVTVMPTGAGIQVSALVIYKDTGVEATSPLICMIDSAAGCPFTTSDNAVSLTWDNGLLRLFRL